MVSDVVIIASCSLGSALFGLFVGLLSVKSGRSGTAIYPQTHVSFERSMNDADRLRFLDEAVQVIHAGQLGSPSLQSDEQSRESYYQKNFKTGLAQGESHSTWSRNSRDRK